MLLMSKKANFKGTELQWKKKSNKCNKIVIFYKQPPVGTE